MKLLLDTHTLLWYVNRDAQLSFSARALIDDLANEQIVSVVSLWEVTIKHSLGKLALNMPLVDLLALSSAQNPFHLLPIEPAHLLTLSGLPYHHNDPFDRLLVAQALTEKLPIVSIDAALDAYGIQRWW